MNRVGVARIVLVTIAAAAALGARAAAQAPAAQTPARPPAEEQAFQQEVQRRADEIVRDQLAEQEAARRLGYGERERKIAEEINRIIPLDIEVVIARFQGDKKVSSLPYTLVVNATRNPDHPVTVLRMGGRVPIPIANPTGAVNVVAGKEVPVVSWQYQEIGTQIDCNAVPLGEGRFDVTLSVEDTGVATPSQDVAGPTTVPILRSFRTKNSIVLRDGQTRQFTVAADRLTGETIRVDVTLRVAK